MGAKKKPAAASRVTLISGRGHVLKVSMRFSTDAMSECDMPAVALFPEREGVGEGGEEGGRERARARMCVKGWEGGQEQGGGHVYICINSLKFILCLSLSPSLSWNVKLHQM